MKRLLASALLPVLLVSSAAARPRLPLTVTAMTPAPGSTVNAAITDIVVTCSAALDATTVGASSVTLTCAGPDTTFGTGDDFTLTPSSVTVQSGTEIKFSVASPLAAGLYRIKVSGTGTEPTGLVNYWRLDEGSGAAAADSGPGANPGTLTNGPTWVTGRAGTALHMTGLTEHVMIGAANVAPPWSVSMWVKREDSSDTNARLMDPTVAGTGLRLEQYNNTNQVGMTTYGVADWSFGTPAPVGSWVHLVFTHDGTNSQLYADTVASGTIASGAANLGRHVIGGLVSTLKGTIDEIRVYNKVLSAGEIATLYALGGGVTNGTGQLLDGEYSGSLPSGNGTDGGDFIATFTANPTVPAAPSGLSASPPSAYTMNLSWTDNASNESGFVIERGLDGAIFAPIGTAAADATAYADSGLASGTTYYYRVRAMNFMGNSGYSNVASASTSTVAATIKIASMTPVPGANLGAPPSTLVVTFTSAPAPATINGGSVRFARAGADTLLDTADDVVIIPISMTMTTATTLTIDLTGLVLPNDAYRLVISGTPATVLGDVNHWRFDEGSGTTAIDSAGTSNGTISGPTYATGMFGGGLLFNGGTDRVVTGASDLVAPWSAAMWVKRTDSPASDARLMDSQAFPTGGSLRLEQYNGTNQVGVTKYGGADTALNYTATPGAWTHLVFTCDGAQTNLYANGTLVDTTGNVFDLPRWHMGSQGSNSMMGVLDDVRVFAKVLSPAEIGALSYGAGAVRDAGGIAVDGEYAASFPTGNAFEGGDFVGDFGVNVVVPVAPSSLVATAASLTQITLTWSDNSSNETLFHIERSIDSLNFTEVVTVPPNTTTYTDPNLATATRYWYRIRASASGQFSGYSNVATAVTNSLGGGGGGGGGFCGALGIEGLIVFLVLRRRKRRA